MCFFSLSSGPLSLYNRESFWTALKAKSTPTVKAGNLVSDIYHGMELDDVLPGLPRHSVRVKFGLFSTQIHTGHLGHVLPFYDC